MIQSRHFASSLLFCALLLAFACGLHPQAAAAADDPPSPPLPAPKEGVRALYDAEGNLLVLGERGIAVHPTAPVASAAAPAAVGGPDDYGYTYDDAIPFNWIEASGGTDTLMAGDSWGRRVGPIPLPFAFKFYAGTYSSVYIAAGGYLAFEDGEEWPDYLSLPNPTPPNNVISPYSTGFDLAGSGRKNRVFYLAGGKAPNRYFIAQWNEVQRFGETELYTFQAILLENGDIIFQSKTMAYNGDDGWYCGRAGIEDAAGFSGLTYRSECEWIDANLAVRFVRPQPSARVQLAPRGQGGFTQAGASQTFRLEAFNNGDEGADTYNVTVTANWDAKVLNADGTALTDTNGDGTPDTGAIAQGQRQVLFVRISTPPFADVAAGDTAMVTLTSARNTAWQRSAKVRVAVPAPFLQVYQDAGREGVRINTADPTGNLLQKLNPQGSSGDLVIVALPDGGHFVAWDEWFRPSEYLRYVVLDREGTPTSGVRSLLPPYGVPLAGSIGNLVAAAAPDGTVGLTWRQSESRNNNGVWEYRRNIYLATLTASGEPILRPAPITDYTEFSTSNAPWAPQVYSAQIAAAGSGRFLLAWEIGLVQDARWTRNIFYTVRETNNTVVKPITQFSATDNLGIDRANAPVLAALDDGHVVLGYYDFQTRSAMVLVEFDSAGNLLLGPLTIGQRYGDPETIAQMADGSLLAVWRFWENGRTMLYYAVIRRDTFGVLAGPFALENPISATGDAYVSAAADAAGHVVLSWSEYEWNYRPYQYYALIGPGGDVLTPATPFLAATQPTMPLLITNRLGYGIAPNLKFTPPAGGQPDPRVTAAPLYSGPPGGTAQLVFHLGNGGLGTANQVVITATLAPQLTYLSAIPAPDSVDGAAVDAAAAGTDTPAARGTTITWRVPSLAYLAQGRIVLNTGVPTATTGTEFPVTLSVTLDGSDGDPLNNVITTQVMAAEQVFTPLAAKGEE
jgi:hypothetical protein